jgi:hypothetical protein
MMPVRVRGKVYASMSAAARAHGVTIKTCYAHLRRFGHLDHLGCLPRGRPRPDLRRPVRIAGHFFPSVSAAATALGLDRKTIRNARTSDAARQTVLRALMLKEAKAA